VPADLPGNQYIGSYTSGVWDGRQSGGNMFGFFDSHAVYWSDSGSGWVDLNGAGTGVNSAAWAVGFDAANNYEEAGSKAVGSQVHATLWHDDAASALDINPLNATESQAYGVSFGHQAGYAIFNGSTGKQAVIWNGTAGSFLNLQPSLPGVGESVANAISSNGFTTEAGTTYFGSPEVPHASYWASTSASFEDLQSYLPANFTSSDATGIWTNNAGVSYVVGYAYNSTTSQTEAMLWEQTASVPEPSSLMAIIPLTLAFLRRRRAAHFRG
jgi:hypothetical protein